MLDRMPKMSRDEINYMKATDKLPKRIQKILDEDRKMSQKKKNK